MQLGYLRRVNIAEGRVLLPEGIVIGMLYKIIPGRHFIVEVFCIYIFQRAEFYIPIEYVELGKGKIAVGRFIIFHFIRVFHARAETEGAVMVKVVAEKQVTHAGLFGRGFQRRVRVNGSYQGQPAGV